MKKMLRLYMFLKEVSALDDYGVRTFYVKASSGTLAKIGIGGKSVRIRDLSGIELPQRYD